jgi:regulator of RNase E activity RraA
MMIELPRKVIETLGQYDSPTICNVIELCNYQPRNTGYMRPEIEAVYPELPPMVGYAVTATFRSATACPPDQKPLGMLEQVRAWQQVPAPRVLVVQDIDETADGAVYGEIVATVLKAFGFAGLVTNGYARDVLQLAPLKFPCFARGRSVSHSYCRWLSVNQPVEVGGLKIQAGDLIHGDANGVTTIPLDIAERVAQGCGPLVEAENILIDGAKEPGLTMERFAQLMETFVKKHESVSRQLSGQGLDHKVGV